MNKDITLYTYLDIRNPMVAWEAAIGRICSVDVLQELDVFTVSLRQNSLLSRYIKQGESSHIKNEFTIEFLRHRQFPESVSRLRGTYFFESIEDAEAVVGRWDGTHFRKGYLTKVKVSPIKMSKYDSEWITSNMSTNSSTEWMNNYLSGETYGVKPLTEVIVSGVGYVLDDDIREQAKTFIVKNYPSSIALLIAAKEAFKLGFNHAAQVVPFLLRKGSEIQGTFIINMNDFENESPFYEALARPLEIPEGFSNELTLPDFRPYGYLCHLNKFFEFQNYAARDIASSVSDIQELNQIAHGNEQM